MARAKKVIDWKELSNDFQKGTIVSVKVVVGEKTSTKTGLKITNLNKKTVTVMEVDRANRKNIFRKFLRTDIVDISGYELTLRKDVLPRKEESGWDSIGQGKVYRTYRAYSNHSKGWSSNAPQYRTTGGVTIRQPRGASQDLLAAKLSNAATASKSSSTTNNPTSGFPMV